MTDPNSPVARYARALVSAGLDIAEHPDEATDRAEALADLLFVRELDEDERGEAIGLLAAWLIASLQIGARATGVSAQDIWTQVATTMR
jgi:hypothetical protein